jgi:hypothetical protein
MRKMLLAAVATLGLGAAPVAFAQTAPAPNGVPAAPQTQPAPASSKSATAAPQYGSVQDLRMVDGVPGATYGNGAIVSPSGDTVTYVNTVPGN